MEISQEVVLAAWKRTAADLMERLVILEALVQQLQGDQADVGEEPTDD